MIRLLILQEIMKKSKDVGMQNLWNVLCYILVCVLLGSTIGVHVAAEPETPMQLVQRLVQAIIRIKPTNNIPSPPLIRPQTPPLPRRRTLFSTFLR